MNQYNDNIDKWLPDREVYKVWDYYMFDYIADYQHSGDILYETTFLSVTCLKY